MPLWRKWQPTPVILPEEFHGERSLAGYSPWGCKESGMTEQLSLTPHTRLQEGSDGRGTQGGLPGGDNELNSTV